MFARLGLDFRTVTRGDLEFIREDRNTNLDGWRDGTPISVVQHIEWFNSLGPDNQAYVVTRLRTPHFPEGGVQGIGVLRLGQFDRSNRGCTITGVSVFKGARGKGYATLITRAGAEFAIEELGMHRVVAHAVEFNTAMMKAIEKAGFIKEGTLRDAIWRKGRFWNFYQYSLLPNDLKATRHQFEPKGGPGTIDMEQI